MFSFYAAMVNEALKAALADVPVVVVTGQTEAIPQLEAELGPASVFLKPFGVPELLARVAELTGGGTTP